MRTRVILLLLAATASFAQDPAPQPTPTTTFHLQASALSLSGNKQTVPGTVIGGTLAITDNISIREDNILVPAGDLQAYTGGLQYALPFLSKKVTSSTVMDGNSFQFYVTGSLGVVHVAKNGGDAQHYAILAGGGLNFDPTHTGKFSVNLFELRYAKLPGYVNNTAIVSSGLRLGF